MRLSIFTTIFIVFMVVVSPLYIISILVNIDGQNRTQRGIYDHTLSNMDFYVSDIEHALRKIVADEAALINSGEINELSRLSEIPYDFDAYRKLEVLLRELQKIKDSSLFIKQTYILFPLSGVKITDRSLQVMTEFDRACVTDSAFLNGFPFKNHASGTYINITSEFHMEEPQAEKISYVIVVQINTERIAQEMLDFFAGADDQVCFIGQANGLTVRNNIDEALLPEITAYLASATQAQAIESMVLPSLGKEMLIAYRSSPYLKTTFVLTSEKQQFLSALNVYRNWTWILSGVTLVLLVVFTVWTRAVIAVPMNKLTDAIRRGIQGDMDNTIEYRSNEEFMFIFQQFNEMLRIQRESINQLYERDLLIKDTELKMLQYQINPHFLYNCYFLMYQMMEAAEYTTVQRMMKHIGSYFSFVTKSESYISLEQELCFCADYIGIQRIRFSNRIRADIADVPEVMRGIIVPRISVQPILENCYKHGLANKERDGMIALRFDCARGVLIVEDNGEDLTDAQLAELRDMLARENQPVMSGLWNVNRRIRSYLGKAYGLSVSRGAWGGLRVEMALPLAHEEETRHGAQGAIEVTRRD